MFIMKNDIKIDHYFLEFLTNFIIEDDKEL